MFTRMRSALILALLAATRATGQDTLDYEAEPIRYSKAEADNPISRLNAEIAAGRAPLAHDEQFGYLPAVLKRLNIRVSSQVLSFGKTSLQAGRIDPKHPRALYFSDDVVIGFVNGGEHGEGHSHGPAVLEAVVTDPQLGAVFYTMDQSKSNSPRWGRETNRCMTCHGGPQSRGVPGLMVRSVFPGPNGQPVLAAGKYRSTHASPLAERWGGWYVTGTHGEQKHLGNFTLTEAKKPKVIDNTAGRNVTDLSGRFDTKEYLSPHSDLVALMVLEHQVDAVNYLTRLRYLGRLPEPQPGALDSAIEDVVKQFLFVGETQLTAPVKGTSEFAVEFARRGPFDSSGRTLREFDLTKRMFRYPLSYMIYSDAFESLPTILRDRVYRRLGEVLTADTPQPAFTHLSAADRRAIREIVRATKTGLPESWVGASRR